MSDVRPLILAIDDSDDMLNQGGSSGFNQYIWAFLDVDQTTNQGVGQISLNYPSDSTVYKMVSIDFYGLQASN